MRQIYTKNIAIIIAFLLFTNSFAVAQKSKKPAIEERNVRAQMQFLAGDAMQGRGSGTIFERIAAEYIGSQLMQFGVEPAGEKNSAGEETYIQTVEVAGRSVLQNLKFAGELGKSIEFGKDLAVFSISAKEISGEVQKLKLGEKAKSGAVVLLMLNETDEFSKFQSKIGELFRDGAAAVLVSETKEIRENWAEFAERKPALGRRGNFFVLSKTGSDAFSQLADGAKIEIKGTFSEPQKTQTWNAVGKITGSDPKLSSEVILLSAHLDHLGVRQNAPGDDKIYNGADDDASGTVAVLELARILASGK